jgi:hypothetical protein
MPVACMRAAPVVTSRCLPGGPPLTIFACTIPTGNPVVRGLVASPEDWPWSSYRSYAYRGGIGSDQRLDLVGGENSTERWLRTEERVKIRFGAPFLAFFARSGILRASTPWILILEPAK